MSSTEVPQQTSSRTEVPHTEITIDEPAPAPAPTQTPTTTVSKPKRLYTGDIVVRIGKDFTDGVPVYGTVLPGPPESEINKSVDGGSSSEVLVHWDSSNKVDIVKVSEVALVDRMLMRGQRVKNNDGLHGTVTAYLNKATVNIVGTTHVIENVLTDRLGPVSAYIRGQEVLYRDWVGVITNIKRNIWFQLDGGRTFYIETMEVDGFMKNDPYWGIGVSCPGVRTHFSPNILKKAKWTGTSMRFFWKWVPFLPYLYSFYPARTTRTEVTQLTVKWLYPAPYKKSLESEAPPETLTQNEIRFLELIGVPSTETIGFSSVRIYRLRPQDQVTSHALWLSKFKSDYMNMTGKLPREIRSSAGPPLSILVNILNININEGYSYKSTVQGYDLPVKVLLRQNEVEIEWDNDTKEIMLSIQVPLLHKISEDPDYPSGVVVTPVHKNPTEPERYGIVQNSEKFFEQKSKIVPVRWIHLDSEDATDFGIHEESVYNIKLHPRHCVYVRGTIVFAKNPLKEHFRAGTVIDIDVRSGKMIVLNPSDNSIHYMLPHSIIPMSKRCYWNFFTRRWVEDDLIPPSHQLDMEYDPEKNIADVTSEILLKSLYSDNNNLLREQEERSIWDEVPFEMLNEAPPSHRFYPFNKEVYTNAFATVFSAERKVLANNTPQGIWIRMYQDRMDLLSVLMLGPTKTPYEDGLLMFDMQLPKDFPKNPPKTKFISYVPRDVSPVLSSDGNFCVSSINWEPVAYDENVSNILMFATKIQELVFSPEPYYAMTKLSDKVPGSSIGESVAYNESVVINMMDSMFSMIHKPWAPWDQLIRNHFVSTLPERIKMFKSLSGLTSEETGSSGKERDPDDGSNFPISPASQGFKIALSARMEKMEQIFAALTENPEISPLAVVGNKSCVSVGILDAVSAESKAISSSTLANSISENKVSPKSSRDTMKNFINSMTGPTPVEDCANQETKSMENDALENVTTAE